MAGNSRDLVPTPPPTALATVLGVTPESLMEQAVQISNVLSRVVREKGLSQRFGQGEHVRVEGWQLAGSLIGFVTKEKSVVELPDGSFETVIALIQAGTGKELAEASGYCGTDEPNWKNKPKYARRSMAITRGISRAYANNFRWLMKLAGFETTPAEEMADVHFPKSNGKPEGYDEARAAMAAEIKRDNAKKEEPFEIPFGAHGGEEVYNGLDHQKKLLAKDAKALGITDRETLSKISEDCMGTFVSHLPAAVKQWVEENRS